jgi:hypothetical protein
VPANPLLNRGNRYITCKPQPRPKIRAKKNVGRASIFSGTTVHLFPHLLSSLPPNCTNKMPVFVRSVAPFLRTARSALHQGNSVNPLLQARRSGASVVNGARTYAAVFERTKPHVNIGVYILKQNSGEFADSFRYNWSRRSRKGTGDSRQARSKS